MKREGNFHVYYPKPKESMSDILFIALIVLGVAGFIFWNTKKATPASAPASAPALAQPSPSPAEATVAQSDNPGETGVARYLRSLPPPPVETGVTRYLKSLKPPAKPETGVARYINSILAAQTARASEVTFEKLLQSIPAPTRESGVARYLKAIESQ
ncbi:MAG: hypothetical protein MUF20_03970 [Methylotetracoccus sp.]|nr:hypothetical protein [Methylotetracoccus sp.]